MTLKTCIQWLLDNKYAVLVNGEFIVTKKLNDEISGKTNTANPIIKLVETENKVVVKDSKSVDEKKGIWNKFCTDACIPHRVKSTNGGLYTVRQYSTSLVDQLLKILNDSKIDYNRLVESTKSYYNNERIYRKLMSNYFFEDIWRVEYDLHTEMPKSTGSSKWED